MRQTSAAYGQGKCKWFRAVRIIGRYNRRSAYHWCGFRQEQTGMDKYQRMFWIDTQFITRPEHILEKVQQMLKMPNEFFLGAFCTWETWVQVFFVVYSLNNCANLVLHACTGQIVYKDD